MLGDPFIHALVAAADQEELLETGELPSDELVEEAALGGEQDDAAVGGALGPDGFDGGEDGFGLEDHALAAAEGAVVHSAVAVVGPIAEVVDEDADEAGLAGACEDAAVEGAAEELGEDGEDVEGHGRLRSSKPSGKSTRMRRAWGLISGQRERAKGMRIS